MQRAGRMFLLLAAGRNHIFPLGTPRDQLRQNREPGSKPTLMLRRLELLACKFRFVRSDTG